MCGLTAALLITSTAIAAASAASTAAVQKKASDRQKEYEADKQRKIDAKAAQENAFYRMEYYRDPMRTAEGANALKQVREYNQRMTDIQQNRGIITGATHEQTVAQQGKAMSAYSDAVSNIRANAERTRRLIGQNWMAAQNNQFQRQMNADDANQRLQMQSAQNAVNNIQNFGSVAQSAISSGLMNGHNVKPAGGNMADAGQINKSVFVMNQPSQNDNIIANQNRNALANGGTLNGLIQTNGQAWDDLQNRVKKPIIIVR